MKALEYRRLIAALRKHDRRFSVDKGRGKGSHRTVFHPDVGGEKRHYPVPYHGEKTSIPPGILRDLLRRFELPEHVLFGRDERTAKEVDRDRAAGTKGNRE